MGIKVRKTALILLSVSILLSGTACNLKRRKRVNAKKFIKQAYQETHVTEWTGPVPEGMEIQYVCVRKQRVNDRSELSDERYEYDDHGHQTSYMDVWANGSYRVEVDYNSDGTVSATRIRHKGSQPGRPSPDSDGFFTYDENGRLVREETKETRNRKDITTSLEFLYDEKGCLIATKRKDDTDWSPYHGYDEEPFPHKEYHVEFEQPSALFSSSFKPYDIVTYYYDEDGLLAAVSKDGDCKIALYTDGVLTGWKMEMPHGYSLYDTDGNYLAYYSETEGEKYEYNDHGDEVRSQSWENGKLVSDITSEYTYDEQGKVIQETSEFWSLRTKDDGSTEELTFTTSNQYTYDEHGLLIIKERKINGKFDEIIVYDYEAVLVPTGTKVPSVLNT